MKQIIIGFRETRYVKDNVERDGCIFYLNSFDSITLNGEGKMCDNIYVSSMRKGLIDELITYYRTGTPCRLIYNKYGKLEGVID